jgi:hypothetical protein
MRTSWSVAALLLLICSLMSSAQQGTATKKGAGDPVKAAAPTPKPIPLKPATVSGYVFALTNGGDLKPARLAEVYMFYSSPIIRPTDSTFAADVFASEVVNGLKEDKGPASCNSTLARGYVAAVLKTIHWGEQHKSQILFAEADEEGKFEITVPPSRKDRSPFSAPDFRHFMFEPGVPHDHVFAPGVYLVVASGRLSTTNAFWKSEVKIEAGETVKLRMSMPTLACEP